jgi:hypothetical protein
MALLSLSFIVLAISLVAWVRVMRGPLRLAGFVLGSAVYAATLLSPVGRVSTALFVLAGFVFARLVQRRPQYTAAAVGLLVAAFVYLRGYDLLVTLLPKGSWNSALATAGLSYLLFKVVHVIVDSAGGALPRLGFWSYVAYCLNFTTFLLGPIQRYQSFVDQWEGRVEPPRSQPRLHVPDRHLAVERRERRRHRGGRVAVDEHDVRPQIAEGLLHAPEDAHRDLAERLIAVHQIEIHIGHDPERRGDLIEHLAVLRGHADARAAFPRTPLGQTTLRAPIRLRTARPRHVGDDRKH